MEPWTDFFVAEAGASAALAGLLVVAISINIERIIAMPALPGRAAQTVLSIGAALVISGLALFPVVSLPVFGWESLATGLAIAVSGFYHLRQRIALQDPNAPVPWSYIYPPVVIDLSVALPFVIGAALILSGSASGIAWAATGVIFAAIATLLNGWVLMIEILR